MALTSHKPMAGDLVAGVGSPRFLRPRFLRPRFLRPKFRQKAPETVALCRNFELAERGRPEVALDTGVADGARTTPVPGA